MYYTFVSLLAAYTTYAYPCQDFYLLLSTKTSYESVRGNIFSFKDCEVKGIWMILRNGARYPPEEQISTYTRMDIIQKEILINHDRYHSGELCEEEIDALRNWTFNVSLNQSMLLSNAGKEELIGIGQRLYTIFPDIFSQNSSSNIITNITSHQISNASAKAFTEGIYGYPLSILNSSVYDELLMNEMNCSAWEKSTKSQKLKNEVDLLENSLLMEELLQDIERRLGFVRSLPLGLVKIMYSLCAYESSWSQVEKSPWCAAFTVEHLKVMEFLNDLIYYYKTGYGNPFTKNLGCEILKDIIRWLNTEEHTPTFYFGHSLLIHKLLVSLGIADGDAPLHGDDYKNSTDRQWRTSYLNPFSANLATVLYKCKERTLNGIQNNFKVAIYLNENIIKLQACNGLEMCDLNDFIQTFSSAIDPSNCNRDFCNSPI